MTTMIEQLTQQASEIRADILRGMKLTETELADNERLSRRLDFFISSLFIKSAFKSVEEILAWLANFRNQTDRVQVETIAIHDLEQWQVNSQTGNISHISGKFFSIEGLSVQLKDREVTSWYQPIINQPEIGILGIVVKKIHGIYYFLMQAKAEPGNIDGYQISPTVQATKSNYTKVHGGKLPLFVELFLERHKRTDIQIIAEGLQSEEGARFWKKNNLNIIIEVPATELCDTPDEFCWMTLGQLKDLLTRDNIVNCCSRSVLSCLP